MEASNLVRFVSTLMLQASAEMQCGEREREKHQGTGCVDEETLAGVPPVLATCCMVQTAHLSLS